ncbi:MAG: single-stranded DNA-binding protein [Armatimonadetes bacterium]|nr:single-stranded DNA-binding protein [Candidatus Hippobium faecium]
MNVVCLIGRLVAQPELKHTAGSNIPVCSFRIAVDRRYKDPNGNKVTDFIDVVAWRQNAQFVSTYFDKGRLVAVQGSLQVRSWQAQDGTNRKTVEVVADVIQAVEKRQANQDGYGQTPIPSVAPPDPFGATDGIPDWSDHSQTASYPSQNRNSVDGVDYDPFSDE